MSTPVVFGIVENEAQARSAVSSLETSGYVASRVSVLSKDPAASGSGTLQEATGSDVGHKNATKAPEGATTGVVAGGALGGLAGWLVGLGLLAIPGVGPFIAAGPILAALSGAAIGATAGGLTGALIGYGIPEYEAKIYADRLGKGHILIGVHALDSKDADNAKKALEACGAHDVKVTSEAK